MEQGLLIELLQEHYGIEAKEIKKLYGYLNQNYRVESDGSRYILKTYPYSNQMGIECEAESQLLELASQDFTGEIPVPVNNLKGASFMEVEVGGQHYLVRLLTFVEGTFFNKTDRNDALMTSLGTFLGNLDRIMGQVKVPLLESREILWDLRKLYMIEPFVSFIEYASKRKLVQHFILQYKEHVLTRQNELPLSLIHNDANELNILVRDNQVTGIIDFGDAVRSWRVNELAVAITYALMGIDGVLDKACLVIASYHQNCQLEEAELEVLYYLIGARLAQSLCNSANGRQQDPDNEYISVSEQGAWELIEKWAAINPVNAIKRFKSAVGRTDSGSTSLTELIEKRQEHIGKIVSLSYSQPIHMHGAAFQFMFGADGATYLDAYNNIPHVGHNHPLVVEAGQRQMARLNTNTRYIYNQLAEYADRLLGKFPKELSKVFFVNSGSAASDLALRLAKHYTGRQGVMVMEHGYHGHTKADVEISHYKFNNPKGPGKEKHIAVAPIPDAFRGKYVGDNDAATKYSRDAVRIMDESPVPIGTFITEPVVGCGGQVPLCDDYLKNLYPELRKRGALCISDEVQVGFGRLGDVFWGYEAQGVVPDIVVLGKPMGNGHPMGAVVTTEEVAGAFDGGVEFFSSFGGNPVSCEVGLAVLDVLADEELQQHAKDTGDYYKEQLWQLAKDHPEIGDVRGSGLFLGVDFVEPNTKEHNTVLAGLVKNELRQRNILVSTDGPHDNVLKSKPPLCFNRSNVDRVVNEISVVLKSR